jgi:hypothetical protein
MKIIWNDSLFHGVDNALDEDCGYIFSVKPKFAVRFLFEDTNKPQIEGLKNDLSCRVGS